MAKPEKRRLAVIYREQGMSIADIAQNLQVSKGTVSIWVRNVALTDAQTHALQMRNPIYNRQCKGAKVREESARAKRSEYQENGRQKARENNPLHLAGCMLYWAEGSKSRCSLKFTNSNPYMVKMFLNFLYSCFDLSPTDIFAFVNCYTNDNLSLDDILAYWQKTLNLPPECFRKSTVNNLPSSSSGGKTNKLPYGVIQVGIHSTEIIQSIYGSIQEYADFTDESLLD